MENRNGSVAIKNTTSTTQYNRIGIVHVDIGLKHQHHFVVWITRKSFDVWLKENNQQKVCPPRA